MKQEQFNMRRITSELSILLILIFLKMKNRPMSAAELNKEITELFRPADPDKQAWMLSPNLLFRENGGIFPTLRNAKLIQQDSESMKWTLTSAGVKFLASETKRLRQFREQLNFILGEV
jgi:hypothetical protein